MRLFALAAAALVALPALASAESASCDRDFKAFWTRVGGSDISSLSAKDLADLGRVAIRGYDACTAGDERFDARQFFDKLSANSGAKPEDIFAQIDKQVGAKR
jgi:hypothetical protein